MLSSLFGALPTSWPPIEKSLLRLCADASIAQSTGSARAMNLSISVLRWSHMPHPCDQRLPPPKLRCFRSHLDTVYTGNFLSCSLGIAHKRASRTNAPWQAGQEPGSHQRWLAGREPWLGAVAPMWAKPCRKSPHELAKYNYHPKEGTLGRWRPNFDTRTPPALGPRAAPVTVLHTTFGALHPAKTLQR